MDNAIRELAGCKAFAKIAMLAIKVKEAKKDVETENTGVVTMHELHLLHDGYKKELKIWNLIAELIEKSDR